MSIRFQYPCPKCDQSVELVTKQAGQEITCPSCNATITAPRLGDLKKLPQIGGETLGRRQRSGNGNFLATFGLVLLVLGGLAGGGLFYYATGMQNDVDIQAELDKHDKAIDELTPTQLIEYYRRQDPEKGLGEWRELPVTRYNNQGAILQNFSYGLFGVSAVGLLMFLTSLTGKKK